MELKSLARWRRTLKRLPQTVPDGGLDLLLKMWQQLGHMRLHQCSQSPRQLLLQGGACLYESRLHQLLHQFIRNRRCTPRHRWDWDRGRRRHHSRLGGRQNWLTDLLPGATDRQERITFHQLAGWRGWRRFGRDLGCVLGRWRLGNQRRNLARRNHLGQGGHIFGWNSGRAGHAVQAGAD